MRENLMQSFLRDESGATAIEYALIASLVSICIVGGATQISTSLRDKLIDVASYLVPAN